MKKPKILIVDDKIEYLEALKRALYDEFEVLTAKSFEETKKIISEDIELFLVDICLDETKPGEDRGGVEILKWIKANYPQKPVIMMSAYRDFDAAVESLNLGAEKFLKKPINIAELKQTIRDLINK